MKKLCMFMLSLFVCLFIVCTMYLFIDSVNSNRRPAIGTTAEKTVLKNIDISSKNKMTIDAQDGNIILLPWNRDFIQVAAVLKLKSPDSVINLEKILDINEININSDINNITVQIEPPERLRLLSRFTTNLEIKVPEKIINISVMAVNGGIDMSGFDGISFVNLSLASGNIYLKKCTISRFQAAVEKGSMFVEGISGNGLLKISHGDTELKAIKGELEYISISGTTKMNQIEGKLKCDISSGRLDIKDSYLEASSSLYSSYGDINAEITLIDKEGKYDFKTANGSIRLEFPGDTGFVIKAKTDKGRVYSDFIHVNAPEKAAVSEKEMSGTVGNSGPEINVYTHIGDIYLKKARLK